MWIKKNWPYALVVGGLLGAYAASAAGLGVSALNDRLTMEQMQNDCPPEYRNQQGECMRSTFRSLYYTRMYSSSGGFGSGK